jgi:hypothetical protein
MFTLGLSATLAMLGLTVDVGWAYFKKQAAQSAAESAAIAAASAARKLSSTFTCGTDLECPSSPTTCPTSPISSTLSPSYNALQVGCYYAGQNGFSVASHGPQSVAMTAGTGYPPTAPNISTNYWVTARVSESIPQLFSRVIPGHDSLTAGARATAAVISYSLTGCAYLLSQTGTGFEFANSSGSFIGTNCSVNVDSSASNAVYIHGSSGSINVAALNIVGGETKQSNSGSYTSPTTVSSFSDPLAGAVEPAPAACPGMGKVTFSGKSTPINLSPGTYCGGISLSGNSGAISFAPGTYILDGGGLTLSGNSGGVTGSGVMFYNTHDSTHTFGPISVNASSGAITLSAPTSGPYQSMLFFEDRSASGADTIQGTSSLLNLVGNLYFKNSTLTVKGSSGNSTDISIVANKLVMSGISSTFKQTTLSTPAAPSAPDVALIE